ncbi:MAG: helix-hairpin-helix domain-containing protein [Saprospiraceae bacterium]
MWYWTLREKRGILVLVLLVFVFRILYFFRPYWSERVGVEILDLEEMVMEIKLASLEKAESTVIQRPMKETPSKHIEKQLSFQKRGPLRIEVNTADEEDWIKIRGIGPVLSKRIIKFRDALGGFCSIDQVGQTYGVSDSVFQGFKKFLFLDQPCNQININQMEWGQLVKHPYIDSRQANAILKFIENRGPIYDLEVLRQMDIFDSLSWKQLLPYLKVSD